MSKPDKIIAQKLIGEKIIKDYTTSLTDKDVLIYALGVGFSQDPLKEQDLKYTYENHDDFSPFPPMAAIANKFDLVSPLMMSPNIPTFSPFQILHAQQRVQFVKPKLVIGQQYINKQQIIDAIDKGKNALIVARISSYIKDNDGKQQLAFYNDYSMIVRGLGGFGYKGKGATKQLANIPKRNPDKILKAQSYPNQAFIYRLSGDINPLHVDPNIASSQNFEKPILHGLASFGIVNRVIVQQLLQNNPQKIKAYQCRFVGHIFPGQGYTISLWKQGNTFIYQAKVTQRNTKCLIGSVQIQENAKL